MERYMREEKGKNKVSEVKTFTVPDDLEEKLHLKANIEKAQSLFQKSN